MEDILKKLDNPQVAITKGRRPSTRLRPAWEKAIRSKSKKASSNPKRGVKRKDPTHSREKSQGRTVISTSSKRVKKNKT